MRVRIVSIVAGVAGMASLGVPALAPAAPHLSLGSDKRIVVYKQHAQLSGRLGSGKRGVEVALKADRFPFGKSATIATTRSGDSGRFGFHVNPILDTNYRVVLKKSRGVHSPLQRVFVVPRVNQSCNLCAGNGASPGGHTLKVKAKILYPTKAVARAETGKRAFFYYAQNDGHNGVSARPHRLKLVKKSSEKSAGGRRAVIAIRYHVHLPRRFRFALGLCVRDSPRTDGVGLPGDHHCGGRSIHYPYGYLGRGSQGAPPATLHR